MEDRFAMPEGRGISRLLLLCRLLHLVLPTAPLCAVTLLLAKDGLPFGIAAGLWGLWFILLPLYLAIWRKGFRFRLGTNFLWVQSGVLFRRDRRMPLESIQYLSTFATPLERLLGLRDLVVHAAGGVIWIPGLPEGEGELLYRQLSLRAAGYAGEGERDG